MSRENRAKQFKPFDALKGLQEALRMKEYQYERKSKQGISEEEIELMTKTILNIKKEDEVRIKYFKDGYYLTEQGKAIIDFIQRFIVVNKNRINFDDIKEIKIL